MALNTSTPSSMNYLTSSQLIEMGRRAELISYDFGVSRAVRRYVAAAVEGDAPIKRKKRALINSGGQALLPFANQIEAFTPNRFGIFTA